jgi:hypothetical protein
MQQAAAVIFHDLRFSTIKVTVAKPIVFTLHLLIQGFCDFIASHRDIKRVNLVRPLNGDF